MMKLFNVNGVTIQGEPITVRSGAVTVGCWFQAYETERKDQYLKPLKMDEGKVGTVALIDENKVNKFCSELEGIAQREHACLPFLPLTESGIIAYLMAQPLASKAGKPMTPSQVAEVGNVLRNQGIENLVQAYYDGRETVCMAFSHIFIGVEPDGYSHS